MQTLFYNFISTALFKTREQATSLAGAHKTQQGFQGMTEERKI